MGKGKPRHDQTVWEVRTPTGNLAQLPPSVATRMMHDHPETWGNAVLLARLVLDTSGRVVRRLPPPA